MISRIALHTTPGIMIMPGVNFSLIIMFGYDLRLAVGTEHVFDLVCNHVLNSLSGGL